MKKRCIKYYFKKINKNRKKGIDNLAEMQYNELTIKRGKTKSSIKEN